MKNNNKNKQESEEAIEFFKDKCPYKLEFTDDNCQWRSCNMECYSD